MLLAARLELENLQWRSSNWRGSKAGEVRKWMNLELFTESLNLNSIQIEAAPN